MLDFGIVHRENGFSLFYVMVEQNLSSYADVIFAIVNHFPNLDLQSNAND